MNIDIDTVEDILGDTANDYEGDSEKLFAAAVRLVRAYVDSPDGADLGCTLQAIEENLDPKVKWDMLWRKVAPFSHYKDKASDTCIGVMVEAGFTPDDHEVQTAMEVGYLLAIRDIGESEA